MLYCNMNRRLQPNTQFFFAIDGSFPVTYVYVPIWTQFLNYK